MCEYKADLFHATTIEHLLASFRETSRNAGSQISADSNAADFQLKPELQRPAATQTIAIAGTFTTEPLEEPLRFWLEELEIPADQICALRSGLPAIA